MSDRFCRRCGESKPPTEFYKCAREPGGFRYECKQCTKAATAKWQINNQEKTAAYKRKWAKENPGQVRDWRKLNPDKKAASDKRYNERNALKIKAHRAVNNAIRDGRLVRMACEVCGDTKSEGHHPDYSKPLDVIWLCHEHHMQAHRKYKERLNKEFE